jgi:SPP1 family predicted phage head-tail adaptor
MNATSGRRNCLCKLMAVASGERNSRGHAASGPSELMKFWCEVVQISSQELIAFNQQYPTATHRVTAPYTQSVQPTPAMWLEYQGRRLNILSINNLDERNREWQFLCSEQVAVRDSDTRK